MNKYGIEPVVYDGQQWHPEGLETIIYILDGAEKSRCFARMLNGDWREYPEAGLLPEGSYALQGLRAARERAKEHTPHSESLHPEPPNGSDDHSET